MALKGIRSVDTADQACRRVFPFFNTYAFGCLSCSWSHFARKQMATEIHLFGLVNTKIWFSTCTEIRDLFANGSRKRFLHKNRGSNDRWSGRSHLPRAVFVLRHVCAGEQATWELSGCPGGSDELVLPVSLVLGVWQAPPTPLPGARLEGGAACVQKSIWKKGDPQLHKASCYPLKNTPFSDTKKAGVINAIALWLCMWEICFRKCIFLYGISFKLHSKMC